MSHPGYKSTVAAALPGTVEKLMKKTGLSRGTVFRWIGELHKTDKACHIKRWFRTTGRYKPYYVAGPGKDAPMPERRTCSEWNIAYRQRKRKAEEPFREARAAGIEAAEHTAQHGDPVIGDIMAALCRPTRKEIRP